MLTLTAFLHTSCPFLSLPLFLRPPPSSLSLFTSPSLFFLSLLSCVIRIKLIPYLLRPRVSALPHSTTPSPSTPAGSVHSALRPPLRAGRPSSSALSAHLLLHESCFTAHVPTYLPPPPLPCNESFTPSEALRLVRDGGRGRGGSSIPYCAAEWQDFVQVQEIVASPETLRRHRYY